MDSTTILDRALFQLTPTRTRFDLVLFYKGKNEKLASGLFEPFICHLKFARDQISKGGYSITLQPPAPATPWFTKATFERFVRFVSTPAVLERFVTIETEILQIERSIQVNKLANANGRQEEENSKVQLQQLLETRKVLLWKEQAMTYARGLVAGFAMENMEHLISFADAFGASRLREACSNFKELCKKKHADHLWMEELAAVEACSPSELPLLGTSGIVLANGISISNDHTSSESSGASKSDASAGAVDSTKDMNLSASNQTTPSKYQVPTQWLNQIPQHMYNFQGQLPQYQGYPFHPMQPVPLPYPVNMQWPPNSNKKSTSKLKKKLSNGKKLDYSGEERETESSGSDSGSESSSEVQQEDGRHSSPDPPHRNKNLKKPSGTVVIRNINYITPKRRSGEKDQASDGSYSTEEDLIDAGFLKQKVDDAVKSLKESGKSNSSNRKIRGGDKSHLFAAKSTDVSYERDPDDLDASEGGKRNGNWDALQNLLMRDEENPSVNEVEWKQAEDVQEHFMARNYDGEISATTPLNIESQKVPIKRTGLVDSFVVTERDETNETRVKLDDFVNGENYHPILKKGDSAEVDLLPPERSVESGKKLGDPISASANESPIIRCGKEDWFVGNQPINPENQHSSNNQMLFNGDHILSVESDPLYSQQSRKDVLIDDSFMVAARPAGDDQDDSQWKTDISMVADLTSPSKPYGTKDVSQDEHKILEAEPIDLCMVLERNPGYESSRDSWTMDYQIDLSFTETNKSAASKCDDNDDEKVSSNRKIDTAKHNEVQGTKKSAKEARSRVLNGLTGRSKAEIVSKSKKPSLVSRSITQKSKLEKEEEMRRKMEELRIERQKRIAERTATAGNASAVSKKSPIESKGAKGSIKNKNVSTAQATNRVNSIKLRATQKEASKDP